MRSVQSKNGGLRSNDVVYFSKIYPSDASRFLIHFLLSMGSFETELDLFDCVNLKECFQRSGLSQCNVHQNVLFLVKMYILEQAQFLPGPTRMFDRNIAQYFTIFTVFRKRID